jgi:hypothetical protein
MKTLNDSLREEFRNSLKNENLLQKVEKQELDKEVLEKAFDILLKFKSSPDLVDKARGEFENYLINHLRTKMN